MTTTTTEQIDLDALLDDVRELIECESPSHDLDALQASAAVVTRIGERLLGAAPERIELDGKPHLRWTFGTPRVVLIGHHDTVWPVGTLQRLPFSTADGVLRGPGCFDMKLGVVMALHAVAALDDRDGVSVLVTADEEIGSPSSRGLIEDTARGAEAALVLEASGDGGALKVGRKGVSLYTVSVQGLAAHAGLEPEKGVNATIEAAHLVLAVAALGDPALGTTVTPTVLQSGTTTNTVPAAASFNVDVRARSAAEQERVDRAMHALTATLPGAVVTVVGGPNRPVMEEASAAALFQRAQAVRAALGGEPLTAISVGGASDGNFTAGIGVPTLDGLGAVGGGAHAEHEHALVEEVLPRTQLVAGLIADVLAASSRREG